MAEALYRKYRPQKFSEVIGQEPVVKALTGALEAKKTTHAYLFSGTRGTGKTSVARILAKELGCSKNDLVEIDAASNTGVDDIRDLQEGVRTLPFDSPVKVYIIDEVHMLSKSAFNALLKTLEEPPAHVVFILATTDVHKVPETVLSRCETYQFRPPQIETLVKTVTNIAKKEGYTLPPDSARLIGLLGDGSFRDAIGILQKVINASVDKKISSEEVLNITGAPKLELVRQLTTAIVKKDLSAALAAVEQAGNNNLDIKVLAKMLMNQIRTLMLIQFAPTLKKEIMNELGEDDKEFAEEILEEGGVKNLPAVLREFLGAYEQLSGAPVPALPLQLALIKSLNKDEDKS